MTSQGIGVWIDCSRILENKERHTRQFERTRSDLYSLAPGERARVRALFFP
jgi:hypothetical protein